MGQDDIIKLLKDKKEITVEGANKKFNYVAATKNLYRLYKQGIVDRRKVKSKIGHYYYIYWLKDEKRIKK